MAFGTIPGVVRTSNHNMNEHINTLVRCYFETALGPGYLLIKEVNGTTGTFEYDYPLQLSCGLQVIIDEDDRRNFRHRVSNTQYIINQPQELLKDTVRLWLTQRIGKQIDLSKLPFSLESKIKRYKRNYVRASSKRSREMKFEQSLKESSRKQKSERAFANYKKKYRSRYLLKTDRNK